MLSCPNRNTSTIKKISTKIDFYWQKLLGKLYSFERCWYGNKDSRKAKTRVTKLFETTFWAITDTNWILTSPKLCIGRTFSENVIWASKSSRKLKKVKKRLVYSCNTRMTVHARSSPPVSRVNNWNKTFELNGTNNHHIFNQSNGKSIRWQISSSSSLVNTSVR